MGVNMPLVYYRIENVLMLVGVPLAPHEFADTFVTPPPTRGIVTARKYIGVTEASLARRMREMVSLGRLSVKRREGKAFVEYTLAPNPVLSNRLPEHAEVA